MDELIEQLGSPGRYQVLMFILLCFNYFPLAINNVIMAFIGARTRHTCDALQGKGNYIQGDANLTVTGSDTSGQCSTDIFLENGENKTLACRSGDWTYVTEDRETNIVTEWDLVCDDAYLRPLASTIYFCGVMVGSMVFGHLADKFGRRPIMLLTLYTPIVIGVGIYFAPSYTWFVVLRFINGIFIQGLQISTFVLVSEMFLPTYRPISGVTECFWGSSVIVLAGSAYLIRNWRYVQLAISLPTVLALFYICAIPESIRWLILHGKFDDVQKLIAKIAKFNKVPFPQEQWMAVKAMAEGRHETHRRDYTFLDLLKTPRLRKRSLILFYQWMAVSVCYFGLILSSTSLAGNKYLNFLIGACVELAACILDIYILKNHKRRIAVVIFALLGAVTLIISGALPADTTASGIDLRLVSTGFVIVARFAIGGLFGLYFLYTSEQFPTVIRNTALGTCMFWTRLGSVLAPQINSLGQYTYEAVPVIVFGVLMLISALLATLLSETHQKKLPDTIADIEGEKLEVEFIQVIDSEKDVMKVDTEETANTTYL